MQLRCNDAQDGVHVLVKIVLQHALRQAIIEHALIFDIIVQALNKVIFQRLCLDLRGNILHDSEEGAVRLFS